ncbi:MAG: Lrp/AsnC family transcriptional regulator [Marinirhabdus sp.]|nr:Lrp/AsnC family transcriptional regulator [Marinirhabdus sp.]
MSVIKENPGNEIVSDIDLQIIKFLRKDGRMPFAQIAKRMGVSTGKVRLHYQKMLKKGVLQIAAITNPLYMGRSKMAMIGIKADGTRIREIINEISEFEEVIYLVLLTGSYDLFAEIVCKDKDHLLDFLTEKLYKVKGIKDTDTFMYLELAKEEYA